MSAIRTLPALLVVSGVLACGLATLHAVHSARVEHSSRLGAQIDLAAEIASERLRAAVLGDRPDLAVEVMDEVLSPAPAAGAFVIGLDGGVLARWVRDAAHEFAAPDDGDVGGRAAYTIRTGRRPIGRLVIDAAPGEASFPLGNALLQGGLPLLVALIGVAGALGGRAARERVRERILEAELVEARSALDSASRAKSMFLANMSHEIRTPLNGVLGMADLLLGTSLDERQRTFAATVRGSAESLLNIVNDLLDFSRVESGSLHLDVLDFCPRECIEDVVQLMGAQAHAKDLELVCVLSDELPRLVRGDPSRMRQVLVNLVGNAIKFTERGEVVVRTSVTPSSGRATFRIEVSDTGIGIAPALQERIFDSFVQLDASTTRRYGGAGLGLAISRHLVELMGGVMTLTSTPGAGSTFVVELALEIVADCAPQDADPAIAVRNSRVLVVDDNDTNRLVLCNQLASWGIAHEAVPGGAEALAALREAVRRDAPFTIAILDMQMPAMDGITLAGHIKADDSIEATRLMLLTSAVVDLTPERLREAGFTQFTSKPVRQSQLYNCLLHMVSASAGKQAAAATRASGRRGSQALGARVLLVEDNAINQEVARHMLQSLGCAVEVAENGRVALERLATTGPVDLILMDCQMPVMDGFEATDAVRERERVAGASASCPIIALTANALAGDREQCLAAGMDDYVSKPFKLEELERVLTRWLPAGGAVAADDAPAREEERDGAAGAEQPADVLDEARLEFIRSMQRPGKPDLVAKVVRLYLDRTPELIDAIAQAVGSRDARALQTAAHSLKSSSANLGATRVAEAARALEQFGREGELDGAPDALETLRDAYPPVRAGLERHLPVAS